MYNLTIFPVLHTFVLESKSVSALGINLKQGMPDPLLRSTQNPCYGKDFEMGSLEF